MIIIQLMIAIVDISGGFGNQLFQYSFATKLKSCGYKVYMNDPEKINYFDGNSINLGKSESITQKTYQMLSKNNIFKNYYCSYFDNNSDLKNVFNNSHKKSILFFNGYWQRKEYVDGNEVEIQSLINNSYERLKLPEVEKKNPENALIHVRRGDYVKNGEALSLDYYEKSINYLLDKKIKKFHIFTDDSNWVKKQKIFSKVAYIEETPQDPRNFDNTYKTFYRMQKFQNFIIANSSFSWWAARLSNSISTKVLSPKPFYLKPNNQDLSISGWKYIER